MRISGWPNLASGCCEQQVPGGGEFHPAAEALPAHGRQHRHGRGEYPQHKAVESRQHCGAMIRQVLLDRRAEAEMTAAGIDQDFAQFRGSAVLKQCILERADKRRVEDVCLRAIEAQAQQASLAVEFDLQAGRSCHATPRL